MSADLSGYSTQSSIKNQKHKVTSVDKYMLYGFVSLIGLGVH
jgi:hypothetical protein